MTKRALVSAVLAAALLLPLPARAADDEAVKQARALFNVGAQAYERGQFMDAIEAFERAYKIAPRHGILFSTAQAYRRQYFVDRRPEHLQRSIALYRAYLQEVREGGRRAEVAAVLEELEPLAARLAAPGRDAPPGPEVSPTPSPSAEPVRPRTRLMLARPVDGARVSVDGGKAMDLPFVGDVSPGNHKVKVSAPGYFDYEREIAAVEGDVVAPEVTLREKPARILIEAPEGADVAIDGRPVGTTPLPKTIELSPGRYYITVTKQGRKPFSAEIEVARDSEKKLAVAMPTTTQRDLSVVMMAAGSVGIVAGGVLALGALDAQETAQEIHDATQRGNVQSGELTKYRDALKIRGQLRSAAGAALSVGAVVGGAGVLLFLLDPPLLGPGFSGGRPETPPSRAPRKGDAMEISAAPLLGPGITGAVVGGRF